MAYSGLTEDWRTNCKTFMERLKEAKKRKLFTDVDFLAGEGEAKVLFSAHRTILALGSPAFEAMFFRSPTPSANPITVNTSPEAMETLLRYLYGEPINLTSIKMAAMTAILAEQCQVDELRLASHAYIRKSNINDTQFWDLYLSPIFVWSLEVQKKCLEHFKSNAKTLLKSPSLIHISPEMMGQIVSLDSINISEFDLLSALIEWGSKAFNHSYQIGLQHILRPFIPFIRFSTMSAGEFCKLHERNLSFVEMADALAILKHLQDGSDYKLPDWCSKSTTRRNKGY